MFFMGFSSLLKGNGGIAMVARLILKAMGDVSTFDSSRFRVVSYSDESRPEDIELPVKSLSKSKLKFLYQVQKAAIKSSHFIYDFAGLARAHQMILSGRKPFLLWMHGIEVWENARPVYANLAKRATLLISNSMYTLKRAEQIHGPFKRAKVCWLGTENNDKSKLKPPDKASSNVTIIGRIDDLSYKGHYPLIQCWPKVVSKVPNARLQIVGTGSGKNRIIKAVEQSGVKSRIDVLGFVPENEMDDIWSRTNVLAMPSRGEGFGLVYIEAMRHGRPVIASIHDAAQEINIDGQTGFNVDLAIPGQLAERVICLLENHSLSIEMGAQGQKRWEQHFSFSAFRNRFNPIIEEFIENNDERYRKP